MGLLDNNQFADDTTGNQPAPPAPYNGLLGNVPVDSSMLPQSTIDALNRQRAMEGIIASLAHAGVHSGPSLLPIPTGAVLGAGALGQLEANRNFDATLGRNLLLGPSYQAATLENQTRALNNKLLGLTVQGWQNAGVPPARGVAPSLLTAPATTAPQTAPSAPAAPSLSPQFQPYIDAAKNAETANNLPPGSVSGFLTAENSAPGSVSKKGAAGPFQLMPDTAKAHNVNDPNDPAQSSAAAAAEAALHYQRYAGDPAMVAAAYNWGSGNVDNWLSNGADPAKMPAETRRYIGAYVHAQSPDVQQRALSYLSPEAGLRLATSLAAPPTAQGLLAPAADTRPLGPMPSSGSSAAPSAANTPLLDPATLVARAQQYNFPGGIATANQLLSMAEKMMPPGTVLMRDGSVALPPGADVAEMTKALAAKGFVRGNDGFFHIDPGYVAGSAALAGAEANAKVPSQQLVERSKFVPLSRPGEQLFDPLANRIVAQNPVLLKGVDPQTGAPFEEYRYLGGTGAPGAAPGVTATNNSDLLGGSYLLPSGRTIQQASAPAAGNNAPPPASAGPITTNEQGLPRVQTSLSPLAESSAKARGTQLEDYGTALQTNATNAVNAQFTIDQMRRESGNGAGWTPARFADWKGGIQSVLNGVGLSGSETDNALANYQSFEKNAMSLVTQATRAVSPRAAVQEMQMIREALPGSHTSAGGLKLIFDQLSAVNDFNVAKNQAAEARRPAHGGTLAGFESAWNESVSPFAFLAKRMSNEDFAGMAANLQKSPEGRALLTRIQNEVVTTNKLGLYGGGTSG
jgi:hypothetical protein